MAVPGRCPGPRDAADTRLLVNDIEAMLLATRSGHGSARPLSYQVVEELQSGSLVRLLADFEPAPEPVHLVFPRTGMIRPSARAFVEFASDYLGRREVEASSL